MGRTLFIADTHWGDESICNITGYPYTQVSEIRNRWNGEIYHDDTIWFLGDIFAEDIDTEYCREIVTSLNGHKNLIMGNHDRNRTVSEWRDIGFENVYDHPIIIDKFFILTHEPIFIGPHTPFAMAYGHVHNDPCYNHYNDRYSCFCVEVIESNGLPVEWDFYNKCKSGKF